MAETIVTLYENDHRPKAAFSPASSVPMLKQLPQYFGGSDTCHFCKKRVYVMERLSAEGRFFHRECFRCHTCRTLLSLGRYTFDPEHGKFYCTVHFAQRKSRTWTVEPQKDMKAGPLEGSGMPSTDSTDTCFTTGSLRSQPPGTLSSFLRKSLRWPLHMTRLVCDMSGCLSRCVHDIARVTGHLRDNMEDYTFLYELLSLGVPLLCVLQEVLGQMYTEAGPISLQYLEL